MAHSRRRTACVIGRAFSGEHSEAAASGIPRGCSHLGFDAPDPGRRRRRDLLVMGIFNMGSLQPSPDTWAMGSMTPYDLVLSPRPDDLVMITPHPPMCSGTWYLGASQWACQVCAWRKQALAPSCCGICSPVRDDSHRPSRRSSHGRRLRLARRMDCASRTDRREAGDLGRPAAHHGLRAGSSVGADGADRLCDPDRRWALGYCSSQYASRMAAFGTE